MPDYSREGKKLPPGEAPTQAELRALEVMKAMLLGVGDAFGQAKAAGMMLCIATEVSIEADGVESTLRVFREYIDSVERMHAEPRH